MSHRIPVLGAAGGVALLLAASSAASAVTGTVGRGCWSHVPTKGSEPLVVTLSGGTPGANFLVAATVPGKGTGSAGSADGTFDAAGNGVAQIQDVTPPSGTIGPTRGQRIQLSVQDFGAGGAEVPIGQTLVTNIALDVATKPVSPRARRRVTVSGTPFAGQRVYGFVLGSRGNRVLRRFALGKADVCGFASAKAIVAPPGFRTGSYRLYVNAGPRLNQAKAIGYGFRIYRRLF